MVNTLMAVLTGLCALVFSAAPLAATGNALIVETDQTEIYQGDVLTVTVKGTMKLDINLSNLFSFDLSDMPAPDIEAVEPDFEILAQNQHYSVRTVNSDMIGEITWTYQLAPTRTGELTIPALTFRDSRSEPVTITVQEGSAPAAGAQARDSFIELSADKAEVYVQEQLVLSVQLYFSGNLIRGELSEPQHPDAIIESLGKQQEFTRYRDGVRYRVVERRYAIFPQQPGELSLAPIRFEGQARDASGQLRFLRNQQQLYSVPVKPVPASYPDNQAWLPANQLSLTETGLPLGETLEAGSNLSRQITLQAGGLPSEALPDVEPAVPDAIRAYPEQPVRNTETTPEGLRSALQQTTAMVPVTAGEVTLPAIRVPWWNTSTDTLEYATLPERQYRITGDSAIVMPQLDEDRAPEASTAEATPVEPVDAVTGSFWFWSTLALSGLWLATLALWWRARARRSAPSTPDHTAGDLKERQIFDQLQHSIRLGSPEATGLLVRWVRIRFRQPTLVSLNDVLNYLEKTTGSTDFSDAVSKYQQGLYAAAGGRVEEIDRQRLLAALAGLKQRKASGGGGRDDLSPLYPDQLVSS
ncbi:MAG: BatD family protein [Pseudomonadota bacterium]|nr:BatD family protein [Pseudomonadota bacterium]